MTSMRPGIEKRLRLAADACRRGGSELTAVRRSVLALILEAKTPPTAYQLLDRLSTARKKGVAPPTIYRALDFLTEHKLVHKIERLNAFVPCIEPEHHGDPAAFLICRECGAVEEVEDAALAAALESVAGTRGFRAARSMVEIEGICAACTRGGHGAG
jgi:Fur family transcriptional regulator, zinc uptake regulator